MRANWLVRLWVAGVVVGMGAAGVSLSAEGPPAPGDPVKGGKLYVSLKCAQCHKIAGVGGKMGPDLSAVGTRRDAAWLEKYLPSPKIVDPKNKMPQVKAKGQDLADLIAYLESLGKK